MISIRHSALNVKKSPMHLKLKLTSPMLNQENTNTVFLVKVWTVVYVENSNSLIAFSTIRYSKEQVF